MPEVSEVKIMVEYLNKKLKDKIITKWIFTNGKYIENTPVGFSEFDMYLPLKMNKIDCKGKFIYFELSKEVENKVKKFYILHSLRMTGNWQDYYDKHCKWFLEIENKNTLWFSDQRSFATLLFTTNKTILQNQMNRLGPDILTSNFTLPIFMNKAKIYPKKNITAFLMDQSIFSGCGNYIKAETLYYAKVSPLRKVGSLSEDEKERIYQGLRIIPRLAYNKGGFREEDFKIYGKKWAKRTKTTDGRITYWNSNIQI